MTATIWRFHIFDDCKTKAHLVPASLERSLIADLKSRNINTAAVIKTVTTSGLDSAGCMVHQNRPWEDLTLPGLEFHVPSESVVTFWDRIRALPLRVFADRQLREYYKLHDHLRCVVLKPAHKAHLEFQLAQRMAEAEKRAAVFYADKMSPAEVLRDVNAKAAGVPVEKMPDFSGRDGHRLDRFFPKNRGQA